MYTEKEIYDKYVLELKKTKNTKEIIEVYEKYKKRLCVLYKQEIKEKMLREELCKEMEIYRKMIKINKFVER